MARAEAVEAAPAAPAAPAARVAGVFSAALPRLMPGPAAALNEEEGALEEALEGFRTAVRPGKRAVPAGLKWQHTGRS